MNSNKHFTCKINRFFLLFIISILFLLACSKQKISNKSLDNKEYIKTIKKCNPEIIKHYLPLLDQHLDKTALKLQKSKNVKMQTITRENKKTLARRLVNEVLKTFRRSKRNERLDFLMATQYRPLRKCFKLSNCNKFAQCLIGVTELSDLNQIRTSDIIKVRTVKPNNNKSGSLPGNHNSPIFSTKSKNYDLAVYNQELDLRTVLKASSPYLLLVKNNNLSIMEKQNSNKMKIIKTFDLSSYGGKVDLLKGKNGEIIIKTKHALLLLDRQFRTLPVWKPEKGEIIGSAYLHDNHLLLGTGRDFVVLNSRFRKIARLDLNIHKRGKEVHDITVHNGQALLLDNIRVPILIFRVNISNPAQPRVIERINEDGIYAHLVHQWVDVPKKRWGIFMNTHGRCGTTQHLLLLKLYPDTTKSSPDTIQSKLGKKRNPPLSLNRHRGNKNTHLLAKNIFYQYLTKRCYQSVNNSPANKTGKNNKPPTRKNKSGNYISGYKFLSGSQTSPFWSLFKQEDLFYLGKLKISGKRAKAYELTKLDLKKCTGWFSKKGGKKQCNNYSYPHDAAFTSNKTNLVVFAEETVYWYKAKNPPKLINKFKTETNKPDSIVLYP
ncbi:MAG: hypothetical protein PF689_11840 [Deltaproteobacteria bacterium]|jgi:hypothetical protein|nr:hypothetical protein [Deltaproteobacteria bacterium]